MEWLTNPEIWVAFFTLTALEIVLGIDNIIMISILVSRMPKHMPVSYTHLTLPTICSV